jgi:hypothetical protein
MSNAFSTRQLIQKERSKRPCDGPVAVSHWSYSNMEGFGTHPTPFVMAINGRLGSFPFGDWRWSAVIVGRVFVNFIVF